MTGNSTQHVINNTIQDHTMLNDPAILSTPISTALQLVTASKYAWYHYVSSFISCQNWSDKTALKAYMDKFQLDQMVPNHLTSVISAYYGNN